MCAHPALCRALALTLLAACGGAEASNLARARTDTLPGGIVRVTSDGPTAWSDSAGVQLIEQSRFQGEDGTESEIGDPRSLAVDDFGRVYVVDAKPAVIKVFTPEGRFVRTIGREGEGPGEFRIGFITVRGQHLVLHDPRLSRTSVFDTAGNYLRSWRTSCCYWSDIQVDRQDRIYIPSVVTNRSGENDEPRGTPYVRWSLDGKELDTLWVPRPHDPGKYWTVKVQKGGKDVGMMSTGIPFMPTLSHTLHPDGGIVYGWSGEYQLVRSNNGSDTLKLFGRAWTAEPVSDARRSEEVANKIKEAGDSWGEENLRSVFRVEDIPTTLPAFLNLRVDQAGRIWAKRYALTDQTRSYFDVFDSTGAYLGPVVAPLKLNDWGNQVWLRDGLVTLIEDQDGVPTVVRLKLGAPGAKF